MIAVICFLASLVLFALVPYPFVPGAFTRLFQALLVRLLVPDIARKYRELLIANRFLEHQLTVLKRTNPRPAIKKGDRLFTVAITKILRDWKRSLFFVNARAVSEWTRNVSNILFARKYANRPPGRRPVARETVGLIRRMAYENPNWGTVRIKQELSRLGINLAKATIQKYVPHDRPKGDPRVPAWEYFMGLTEGVFSMDFFAVKSFFRKTLFCLLVVNHSRRQIVRVNVTTNPTEDWVANNFRGLFGPDDALNCMIHDNDAIFSEKALGYLRSLGFVTLNTRARSPWQNGVCERLIGTVRRELIDLFPPPLHAGMLLRRLVK